MRIDESNNRHIYAEKGKVFRRISDGEVFGSELWLGYTHYLGGELLPKPLWELPEHYEEIEEPMTDDTVILDEETVLYEEPATDEEAPQAEQLKRVTVADYRALEAEVQEMKRLLQE